MADNKIMEEIFRTIDIITDHKLYLTEYLYTEDCVIIRSSSDNFTYTVVHEGKEFEAISPIGIKYNLNQSVVVLFADYSRISKKIILYGANQKDTVLNNNFIPSVDNTYSIGSSFLKWSQIYANNGSIITSDLNEKQDIEELSDKEKIVAVKLKGLIKKYRLKDAVSKKGDEARIHVGFIAQEVEQAFLEEGLDPNKYGLFCKDVLYEKNGRILSSYQPGSKQKIRLGLRYEELLAFIISSIV